ncbi:MAG: chemotaxis protein CheA [Planctomycetes bacterium]|nr:chemotaxis protein CheA [Planctomycetota bacterium]
MSESNEFVGLVQQAASAVNMAGAGDSSDMKALEAIFDKINAELKEISDFPDQLQEEAIDATESAKKLAGALVSDEVADAHASLNVLSDTVVALQEMADKAASNTLDSDFQAKFPAVSDQVDRPADVEEPVDEAAAEVDELIIPEEDAPMVLDFIAEAGEHIEAAEAGLLELENAPDDTEAINTIFRGFHTIKGMAGFLNLTEIGSLAHVSENLLDLSRQGKLQLVGSNMDVIFESIDLLKKMSSELQDAIEAGTAVPGQPELAAIVARINDCAEGKAPNSAPAETAKTAETTETVSEVAPETTAQEPTTEETVAEDTTDMQEVAEVVEAKPETTGPEAAVSEPATGVEVETQPETQSAEPQETEPQVQEQVKQQASAKVKQISDEKIKVSTNRLDELVNMAGELVIAQSMVSQQAINVLGDDNPLCTKISHQGKIVRELQELSMLMRMVPIQGVFGKMARLVRDLSRKSGKQINFVTQGEETELDRNVVDQISDPLVHMVRNSIDHGIEACSEDRVAAGKESTGVVQLRAFHQAGNIVIEIEDDGRGLDKEKILAKAIKNGIVDPGQDLSDAEIYKLVFHAGLSTAEKITSISGRGVGMDVVKKNIESLRGKVEITSKKGKGTVFSIRLPLTLAIIEGQVIRIGNQKYIIPILSIERCLRPSEKQLSTVQGKGEMAHVQGELLPVVRLYRQFGVTPDSEDPTKASLVVVEEDGRKGAFMVDELLDQQQTVIKSLGESFGNIKGVSGGAIMGDGRVSLILDVPGLLESASY